MGEDRNDFAALYYGYIKYFFGKRELQLCKNWKRAVSFLLVLILSIFLESIAIKAKALDDNKVNLILDALSENNVLPKNFRKTTDLTTIKDNKALNLNGLDKLNISGSQQFSEDNLPLLVRAIGNNLPMTVLDLRQESHVFINGFAVSWEDSKNNANAGLTREQILVEEADKLKSIKLNVPISFYNHP